MLLGTERFIGESAVWRRRLGANPYTVFPYALSCRHAYRTYTPSFEARWRKLQRLVPLLSAAAQGEGGSLRTVPPVPLSCQAHVCIRAAGGGDGGGGAGAGSGAGVGAGGDGDGAMAAMDAARDAVEAKLSVRLYGRLLGEAPGGAAGEYYFELSLGPAHVEMADAVFVDAWRAFFRELSLPATSAGPAGLD